MPLRVLHVKLTQLYVQIYLSQTPQAHRGTHRETLRHMHFLCFCLQSGSRRSTGLETRRLAAQSALLPVNSGMPPPYPEKMCPWPGRFQAPSVLPHSSWFQLSPSHPTASSLSPNPLAQSPGPFPGLSTAPAPGPAPAPPCTPPGGSPYCSAHSVQEQGRSDAVEV